MRGRFLHGPSNIRHDAVARWNQFLQSLIDFLPLFFLFFGGSNGGNGMSKKKDASQRGRGWLPLGPKKGRTKPENECCNLLHPPFFTRYIC
jgi:hypothetical protein